MAQTKGKQTHQAAKTAGRNPTKQAPRGPQTTPARSAGGSRTISRPDPPPARKTAPVPPPAPPPASDPAPKIRYAELPLISVLPNREVREAKELFEELEGLEWVLDPDTNQMVKHDERVTAIKTQLGQLQQEHGLDGLRFGRFAFRQELMPGRKTLDQDALKVLLVEAGVDVDVVAECFSRATKTGADYLQRNVKLVGG